MAEAHTDNVGDRASKNLLAQTLEKVLDGALETQWKRATSSVGGHRRRSPHASPEEIAKRLVSEFARDVTVIGAAGGAVAAVPGPGTIAKLTGGMAVETSLMLERASYMILGVADAYGLDLEEVAVRRYAVLRVLGAWAGVSQGATGLAGTLGAGLGKKATQAIPMSAIHGFNRAVGKQILFKWATRSGTIRLGSALPFGIGAGIGGGTSYLIASGLGRAAIKECQPIASDVSDEN